MAAVLLIAEMLSCFNRCILTAMCQ